VIRIVYPNRKLFRSFYGALGAVAAERVHIEMVEPPPFATVAGYQAALIRRKGPVYYAVDRGMVVGWCDVFPEENPRLAHRGRLGMGLLPEYRGRGIGSRLLRAALAHARRYGLEKVELSVYTSNRAAIGLYRKFGFRREGLIRRYRKVDGRVFDALEMARFFS
jgi:ribosomal protein S18 acetylase RimI-like enzyme